MSGNNKDILKYVGDDGEFLHPIAEYLDGTPQESMVPEETLSDQPEFQPVWFQEIDPSHVVLALGVFVFLLMVLSD